MKNPFVRNGLPPVPACQEEAIKLLWEGVYNHYTKLGWIDMQIKFVLGLLGVVVALLAIHLSI